MNPHLIKALDGIEKADAILYALDETFLEDADSKLQQLVYAVWDVLKMIGAELDLLADDRLVVSAIYAVNDARNKDKKN